MERQDLGCRSPDPGDDRRLSARLGVQIVAALVPSGLQQALVGLSFRAGLAWKLLIDWKVATVARRRPSAVSEGHGSRGLAALLARSRPAATGEPAVEVAFGNGDPARADLDNCRTRSFGKPPFEAPKTKRGAASRLLFRNQLHLAFLDGSCVKDCPTCRRTK
jgi:hypothetical protein